MTRFCATHKQIIVAKEWKYDIGHPNSLPIQPLPFIGRDKEIAACLALLLRSDVRLLTLTGAGGAGKTRLALQVAADLLDDFAQGVFFVHLAPTRDPDLVASAIAQALCVRETSRRPALADLSNYLRQKQMLLVLDNFEQVMDAGPLVGQILGAAPG